MNKFAQAIEKETAKTFTENGATAINTTGNELLDFFSTCGSLRKSDETRICRLFADAYKSDPLLATKCLFYTRDIRGGLGERRTFRILLKYLAINHPEAIKQNIELIPEYGRFDDLYELIGTPLEQDMWDYVEAQLDKDLKLKHENKPCSLLAKWLKTANTKGSRETAKLGVYTAKKLNFTVKFYNRVLKNLRSYLKVVEQKMCAKQWNEIDYQSIPSRAANIYRNAFFKHDELRYKKYLDSLTKGEAKVNASTLYPYDIVESYARLASHSNEYSDLFDILGRGLYNYRYINIKEDQLLEAQWKALPDYVGKDVNAIVIADTSGSMSGRPINAAVSLAVYFAERNTGAFHNLWMSFSKSSKFQKLKGETLLQKLLSLDTSDWDMNTNLKAAFNHILDVATSNHISNDEMVKSIIVISDMEIDACCSKNWLFYDTIRDEYRDHGYDLPNIVFWNVNSRHDIFHADANRKGVQLVSGSSPSTFKYLIGSVGKTPTELMLEVLNSPRYSMIKI